MFFLYRIPLFHFNIDDPAELELNRETLLEAITLSSTVFYRELQGKAFSDLEPKLRIKLRKYLLRGRFRPTPFGKFAGVGVGKWGNEINLRFPLHTEEVDSSSRIKPFENTESALNTLNSNYWLVPGIHKKLGYYHALIFDDKSKHWKGCKLPVNGLFETLIHQASKQPIDFLGFQNFLNPNESDIASEQAKNLWEQILKTGFLTPEHSMESQYTGTDMAVQNHL